MKILFLIFTHNHGIGGHYYSFNVITKAILAGNSGKTVELGWHKSNCLDVDNFAPVNPFKFLSVVRSLIEFCKINEITHIHCFDIHSTFFGRLMSTKLSIPLIVTRCGGKNPRYFPRALNVTCFSKENYTFFEDAGFVENLYLIPNRVERDFDNTEAFFASSGIKIVSIGRIGPEYIVKHSKSIQLIQHLKVAGIEASLSIIGIIECEKCFAELEKAALELPVSFFTTKPLTINSARFISNFDFTVGTGRGCMESLQRGVPVLVCSITNPIPVLLDENNFEQAFSKNFSMRVDCKGNADALENLINHNTNYLRHSTWCKAQFEEHFCVEKAKDLYLNIYEQELPVETPQFFDLAKNWLYVAKHFLSFKLKSWRVS